jgi:integrase
MYRLRLPPPLNNLNKSQKVYKTPILSNTLSLKRRKTSFGNYPKISLKMARDKRDEFIRLIFSNIDPLEDKKENQLENDGMCENFIILWLENEKDKTVSITHKSKVRIFHKDVIPYLKNKHIQEVTIKDIVQIIEDKQKTAPEIASRLYNYLENLFKYAVLKGYIKKNILGDIRKSDVIKSRTIKHMPKISDKEIFKELVNSIYDFDGSESVKNALKFVLHLPLRAENLCNLKWEHIDFDKKILNIPREQMKVKNINLDNYIIPLTNEVINILDWK